MNSSGTPKIIKLIKQTYRMHIRCEQKQINPAIPKVTKSVSSSNQSLFVLLSSCLISGPNPKINRFIDKRTNTELILLSLDASKIAAKNIAFSEVGDTTKVVVFIA